MSNGKNRVALIGGGSSGIGRATDDIDEFQARSVEYDRMDGAPLVDTAARR